MPDSFPGPRGLIGVLAVWPWLALAQAPGASATPETPAPPLQHHSVTRGLATGVEPGPADWVQANAAVGQFPRGHVDLLKWEQAQDAATAPMPQARPPSEPGHHPHRGHPGPGARDPGARP
jgi:hypothetical protein